MTGAVTETGFWEDFRELQEQGGTDGFCFLENEEAEGGWSAYDGPLHCGSALGAA